jgi:hypothetical protein
MDSSLNDAQLNLALQALKKNPKLSIQATAKIYSVPKTTILRRRNQI